MAFDKRKALQNALAYTQQGKWDRAIAEYQSILKADPRDVTVCNNLGDLYARAGKTADAIDQYLKLGELYRADGLSVKAIAVYKKIAKLDPARTEAYLACADLYWEEGLVGEAKIQMATVVEHYTKAGETQKLIGAYRRLTQFDPTNSMVIARLADATLREGNREAAAAEYERAAQVAQAAGQSAEAKRLRQRARDLLPGAPAVTVASAERLIGDGKTAEAIEALKRLIAAEAGNGAAWRLLGEVQASRQQAGEAIEALQRAVVLGVPEADIARPLGRALLQTASTDEVMALCRRVTQSGLAAGEPDLGIGVCRDLLAAAPEFVELHAHLAATLQDLGRIDEARAAVRALAIAQESGGNTAGAIASYHRLLELDSSDRDARLRLETLEPPPATPESGEPPPPLAQDERPQPVEVSASHDQVEMVDPSLSPLEDLGLSLAPEDAALLLEESDAAEPTGIPVVAPVGLEPDSGGADEVPGEGSETIDWLTQELHAIDLDQAASTQHPQPTVDAWTPDGLELEHVPADRNDEGWSGLDGGVQVDLEAAPAPPVEMSPRADAPVMPVSAQPAESESAPLDPTSSTSETTGLDRLEDDPDSGHIAEQLAEAEVYQKYGLEEKARERLLEVIRVAPENLTAHRRLKAIYLDRRQTEEACAEVLAIARLLRVRGQEAAAAAEAREGLLLAPEHAALHQFLMGSTTTKEVTAPARSSALPFKSMPVTSEGVPTAAATKDVVGHPETGGAGFDGAPPPDVPLLLEWDDVTLSAEATANAKERLGSADVEALPTELQALLEDNEVEPLLVANETGAGHDQAMADDLAEAEFFLSQGMTDEARAVHRRMQTRDPAHPAVASLADRIERAVVAPSPDAPGPAVRVEPPLVEASPDAEPTLLIGDHAAPQGEMVSRLTGNDALHQEESAEFVDLGAELGQELGAGEEAGAPPSGEPVGDGLLKELQKGVREHLDEKDYETHYNLGIAYKEMELYDEAIQEFRLTACEQKRALECADLVALCYLAKGQPEQAIQDLQAGLAIEGHPSEAYHNLRYDLGTAFETIGDVPRALEQFEILQAEGARFLDVQTRVQALRAQLAPPPAPAATSVTSGRKNKKKISFI